MDYKTWAAILVFLAPTLVLQLYVAFTLNGAESTDKLMCDYISRNYQSNFIDLLNTTEQFRTTCCSFVEFSGYSQCRSQ